MSQSSPTTPVVRGAQVTTEDGGRLNAFATEPRMEVVEATQGWGFHDRAEKLNGRMAMLGFIALLATELGPGRRILRSRAARPGLIASHWIGMGGQTP